MRRSDSVRSVLSWLSLLRLSDFQRMCVYRFLLNVDAGIENSLCQCLVGIIRNARDDHALDRVMSVISESCHPMNSNEVWVWSFRRNQSKGSRAWCVQSSPLVAKNLSTGTTLRTGRGEVEKILRASGVFRGSLNDKRILALLRSSKP